LTTIDMLGYVACALVLTTFCMNSLVTLRFAALLSNVAFIAYAYYQDLPPIMLLHAILVLINGFRLSQYARQVLMQKVET